MPDLLVPILFGWPAIITSLLLSLAGLLRDKPWLLVAGGVLIIPFAWYLSGYPMIGTPAILLPLCQFGAGWMVRRDKKARAWLLLAPLAIIAGILAIVVLTQ